MYRAVEICWQSILLSAKWPSPHFWEIKVAPYQVLTAMEIKCSSSLTNMEIMEISNFVQRKHIHFTRTQIKGLKVQNITLILSIKPFSHFHAQHSIILRFSGEIWIKKLFRGKYEN